MAGEFILIVEDSSFLANLIAQVVTSMGHEAHISRSGEEALAILDEQSPNLVILDWVLPGIQGIDVLRAIRAGPHASLAVIMLTAKCELPSRLEGLDAGADDYVVKPVHMQELQARIAAMLRR